MSDYVIRDIKSGRWVAYPGLESSFTNKLQNARRFPTREIAEKEQCPESEVIETIEQAMDGAQ